MGNIFVLCNDFIYYLIFFPRKDDLVIDQSYYYDSRNKRLINRYNSNLNFLMYNSETEDEYDHPIFI